MDMSTAFKVIPAPIDEKNVTTDWIEELFDDYSCIWGGKSGGVAIGFRDDHPFMASVSDNTIVWRFMAEVSLPEMTSLQERLVDDLASWEAGNEDLLSPCEIRDNGVVIQKFYFKVQ